MSGVFEVSVRKIRHLCIKFFCVTLLFRMIGQVSFKALSRVTRFDEISPLWQNLKSLWQIFEGKFSIWQNLGPILAKFVCN